MLNHDTQKQGKYCILTIYSISHPLGWYHQPLVCYGHNIVFKALWLSVLPALISGHRLTKWFRFWWGWFDVCWQTGSSCRLITVILGYILQYLLHGSWWPITIHHWVGVTDVWVVYYCCWPTFTHMIKMSDYLSIRHFYMYWDSSRLFCTIPAIHFSQALKVHTKTRSPSTNSLCFACWSCLSLAATCLSYMCCCRSGWTLLSLVVNFLFMSSSAGNIPVVVCGVVQYCRQIWHMCFSPACVFFKDSLTDCTALSVWPFIAGWFVDKVICFIPLLVMNSSKSTLVKQVLLWANALIWQTMLCKKVKQLSNHGLWSGRIHRMHI